jgi:hypothetical protein
MKPPLFKMKIKRNIKFLWNNIKVVPLSPSFQELYRDFLQKSSLNFGKPA